MLRSTDVHPDSDELCQTEKYQETWFEGEKRLEISATSVFLFPIGPSGCSFFFAFSHLSFYLLFH